MSRPSREPLPGPAVMAPAPIDVRVVPGAVGDTASVGGVPVTAAEGQEIKHAVLAHLRRIAVAAGHAVLATIRDERSGYIVPIQVEPDGSSTLTAEPVPIAPRADEPPTAPPGTVTQPTGVFGSPCALTHALAAAAGSVLLVPETAVFSEISSAVLSFAETALSTLVSLSLFLAAL